MTTVVTVCLLALALFASDANALGCALIDKHRVARVMGVDAGLVSVMGMEIPTCANIHLMADYVGFVLNEQNQVMHNGVRSEVLFDYPFNEGETVEYRWSVMFPSASPPGGRADQWWLIAQWHDQPDLRRGETWASLKPQSPPVAIYVERRAGVLGMGVTGLKGRKLSWSPVPLDTWLEMRVSILWSTKNDGLVTVQVPNQPRLGFLSRGVNMLNTYQHYFKVGQYRAPSATVFSVVYVKNISITKFPYK